MSNWRQFPRRESKATLTVGEPLNIFFTMGLFVAFAGHGSRNCTRKLPRRWWGHKHTVWMPDPLTGRMVKMGHTRV